MIKINTVVAGGSEIEYVAFGEGERAFVMLPGLGVKSVLPMAEAVKKRYACLLRDFRVYLIDRPAELPDGARLDYIASVTADAIKALGLSDVTLYGVSQGGMIAQYIALLRPSLVSRLVLCSTSSRVCGETYELIKSWMDFAIKSETEGLYADFCDRVYSPDVAAGIKKLIPSLIAEVTPDDLRRFAKLCAACDGFDVSRESASLKMPTLVVHSSKDAVIPVSEGRLTAKLAGAEYREYEGFSHALYDEAPDFPELIRDFCLK